MTVGTDIMYISRPDPEWQGYESLLPEPREWRQLEDRRLIQVLLDDAIDPDDSHRLIHRVGTSSPKGAEALKGLFETLQLCDCQIAGTGRKLTVVGVQETSLDLDAIHKVAWILESRAPKARGEYMGWSLPQA